MTTPIGTLVLVGIIAIIILLVYLLANTSKVSPKAIPVDNSIQIVPPPAPAIESVPSIALQVPPTESSVMGPERFAPSSADYFETSNVTRDGMDMTAPAIEILPNPTAPEITTAPIRPTPDFPMVKNNSFNL